MNKLRYLWIIILNTLAHRKEKDSRQKKRRIKRELSRARRDLRLHEKGGG